jgi:hypothetical protein
MVKQAILNKQFSVLTDLETAIASVLQRMERMEGGPAHEPRSSGG